MHVIALAQQKGGVGKSTLAIHMAVELKQRNWKVAIFDMDPQGTATKWAARRNQQWPQVSAADALQLGPKLAAMKGMDCILLDLPGRRAADVNEGMRLASFIIVPARPLDIDLEASGQTIASARRMNKRFAFAMTAAPPGSRRALEFTEMIKSRGLPVIPAVITERLDYPDAIAEGLGVLEWRPASKAAAEMSIFTTAVLKELRNDRR